MGMCMYSGWVQYSNDKRNVKCKKKITYSDWTCVYIAAKFKNSNSIRKRKVQSNSKVVIILKKEKYNRKIKQINRHKFVTFWFC